MLMRWRRNIRRGRKVRAYDDGTYEDPFPFEQDSDWNLETVLNGCGISVNVKAADDGGPQ